MSQISAADPTVDTAHSLITEATAREALYVAATRGRRNNTITTITDDATPAITSSDGTFAAVLHNPSNQPSAHQTRERGRRKLVDRRLTSQPLAFEVDSGFSF